MHPVDFESAKKKWIEKIGKENVITNYEELKKSYTTSFLTKTKNLLILTPESTLQVQDCLRIANERKIPIYPTSGGKNWGYGSRVPTKENSVLLDLRKMNKILEFNEELAYLRIQPGVTQQQAYDFLQKETQGRLWLDTTASSVFSSLIGNIMERGHGTTPYSDHIEKCCNFQVVLANGTLLNTGYGGFENSKTKSLDKWAPGPSFEGLFSQSNLGIVTEMTIWLMPAPEYSEAIFVMLNDDDQFEKCIDIFRSFRLKGILKSGPHIGNVYMSLLRVSQYPWQMMNNKTPLPIDTAKKIANKHGIGLWNAVVGLHGSRSQVKSDRKKILKALKGHASFTFHLSKGMSLLSKAVPSKRASDARKVFNQLTGGLSGHGSLRAFWRKKETIPTDPAKIDLDTNGCGFLFVTAVSPFIGADARTLCDLVTTRVLEHGFEPNIGTFPTRDRCIQYYISIAYDRMIPGEDDKALQCQKDLSDLLSSKGYYPHRLTINTMETMERYNPEVSDFLKSLKKLCDPENIIAPGRYSSE